MIKLYKKNELWFAIGWIILYVVVMGSIKRHFGVESIYQLLPLGILAAALTVFIVRNGLTEKYGLVKVRNSRKFLFFIPLILIATSNLWTGISINYDIGSQIIAMLTMALVGYVEEVIFRGLLFRAIEKDGAAQAMIISAVTFGAGHIVNLFTGQALLETLFQVVSAVAIGFAFVLVFCKSKSLLPCIITHSVIDVTYTLGNQNSSVAKGTKLQIIEILLLLVAGGYALYLHFKVKAAPDAREQS